MTTVSSEIEKILQKVVYNAVKLSRLYELEAEYVPDCSEALSKLEELMVEARTAALLDSYISLKNGHDRGNLKVGNAEILLNAIDDRIKALQKGDK